MTILYVCSGRHDHPVCLYETRILQSACYMLSFMGKLQPANVETFATYRVIQGERSVFWEVIVSTVVRKQGHINVYLILNVYRDRTV